MNKILKHMGFMVFLFCMSCLLYPLEVEAGRATDTGYGKDNFTRVVIEKELRKQEVSSDFTFDSDADEINQVLKVESSSTTTQGNTAGIVSKGYYANNFAVGNSEITGATTIIKNKATQGAGAKSAIQSLHVHSETTTKVDRGLAMFGSDSDGPTSNFYLSTGNNDELIRIVAGTEGGFTASSLKNSDSSDIKCDGYFVVYDETNAKNWYIPVYDTLN